MEGKGEMKNTRAKEDMQIGIDVQGGETEPPQPCPDQHWMRPRKSELESERS